MTTRLNRWLVAGGWWLVPIVAAPLAYAARPIRPAGTPEPVDAGPAPQAAPTPEPAKPESSTRPVGKPAEPPKKPVGAKPELPPELQVKAPPPPKVIENPAEVTYRQKVADHAFALKVRPGNPRPGETLELVLELSKLHDPPDPVVGDREPDVGEDLVVSLEKGKAAPPKILHALGTPGIYGAHFSPTESGLYTVRIARRSGKPGIDASFPLGIGVATPVRPDDVAATLSPTAHGPVHAEAEEASGHAELPQLMRQLGDKLLALDAAISSGKGDAAAQARAMAELAKGINGQTPPHNENRPREFDQQATNLQKSLAALAASPTAAKLADVEQNHCWKCHAEYRWGVASDVSNWPAFTSVAEVK